MRCMFECKKCKVVYVDSSKCLICGRVDLPEEAQDVIPYVMRDQPV
ncbi:MAG: hypothetical protein HY361_03635 [Candidatus Aenigmarchaeota archaeon]|nr:hypothetical protein [Candidatus Aenigmarchaeota archaeon]